MLMKSDEFKVKFMCNLTISYLGIILNEQCPLEFLRMPFDNVVNWLPA